MVKTKPTKHKEENTFKFKSFTEQLSSVNVDVIHRVDLKRNAVPDETETFFYECLEKWSDLNCTEGYTKFRRRLGRDIQSLGQLLLNEEKVLDLLLEHIDKENVLFLQPILELVVAVAKDLQSDFYPKFPNFFVKLVNLLKTREPEIIEWTFITLAFLYKNLWRLLVKDIKEVYGLLCPLLASDQPAHVQQFAAESFAFIGRKVHDQKAFIQHVFERLLENSTNSLGVGQLLFQLVKGVKSQFHTSLETFLPIYFQSVSKIQDDILDDPVFKAVAHCFVLMARHTSHLHCTRVWKILLDTVNSSEKPGVCGVMIIVHQWINYREGELITDVHNVSNALANLLSEEALSEQEQETVSLTVATLINSAKAQLSLEQISRLGQLSYSNHWKPDTVLDFTLRVCSHGHFDSHILPHYLTYCHSLCKQDHQRHAIVLKSIAKLVTAKAPLPKNGNDIQHFKVYPLEFTFAMRKASETTSVPHLIQTILEKNLETMVIEDFQTYVNALVCLRNVRPVESAKTIKTLKRIITEITAIVEALSSEEPQSKRMKNSRPSDFPERLGLILGLAILCARHFSSNLKEDLPWAAIKSALLNDTVSSSVFYLRATDFYFTSLRDLDCADVFSLETLRQVYDSIGQNIVSAYHEVRLLTSHILSLFSTPMLTPPENVTPTPVFQICFNAEMVSVGVQEQRVKFNHLQNLEAERVKYSLPIGNSFTQVPLQYLLSQLYVNFRPLWEPVFKLIESHATSMEPNQFWSIYLPFMESVHRARIQEVNDPSETVDYLNIAPTTERLDFTNTRSLTWSCLSRCRSVVEKHGGVILKQFLDFWNTEYYVDDKTISHTQDLTVDALNESAKSGNGNMSKLLAAYLSVIASLKNPRKFARESEVTPILFRLLYHRLGEVQKLALDCLVAYGYPYLTPYKDNLYRLLNDKSFRSELVAFSIDPESSEIKTEHREGLLPILVRIMYGKMMFKTGPGSAGKDNIQHRQGMVLRYFAGLADSELGIFFDLAFQLFKDFTHSEDIYQDVMHTMRDANPKLALPPKRVQGALVLMEAVFSKLGNLMVTCLPKLLHMLLNLTAHVVGLLEKRSELEAWHVSRLKDLRTLGFQRLIQFFNKFERYPWTAIEIEAVFHVYVWPQLDLLVDQVYSTATPLLRLIQTWSANPRYFVLFAKSHPERHGHTILKPILSLLCEAKTGNIVCSMLMEIVDKLVTTADYGTVAEDDDEEKEEPVHIVPNFLIDSTLSEEKASSDPLQKPNYGSLLLIPQMSLVLSYLKKLIPRGLNSRDLNVLMRISEYVKEADLSTDLARTVIPAIKSTAIRGQKNPALEEKLTHYLETLANLLQNANNPQELIGALASLFGIINGRTARQGLCKVLGVICLREPSYGPLGELASSMNQWDRQRLDEPDYMHRLKTHKEINLVLEKGSPTSEWTALVLYNCFYFVRSENDISLLDNASLTLQTMTITFGRVDYGKNMLNNQFIPQLRQLIRSTKESIRHEGLSIMGKAVQHCGDLNSVLLSLRRLRKPDEPEVDFFENSRHLQTHRRSRALLRLTGMLKSDRTFVTNDTIVQYILPLATCFLFKEEYAKHLHLIDASLECLQAIARCLSWQNYEKLLRFYLSNMIRTVEYQRQAAKVVVAILNGFHFDLKSSKFKSFYAIKAEEAPSAETIVPEQSQAPENDVTTEEAEISIEENAFKTGDVQLEIESTLPEAVEEKNDSEINEELATKIHAVISEQFLPELNDILTARSNRDKQHKYVKDHYPEDEEILRVPIALALVHLLKNLPPGTLEQNLPGMFSKVCTFLKSRCNSVRETARDTIIQMILSVGAEHLKDFLDAASPILQRGYQVHVYIFTVHAILSKLVETRKLKPGALDPVVTKLVELCRKELHGDTADEKEVEQIVNKLKEAKGVKAYSTLHITSKHISQACLLQLILPFKQILSSTKSHKMIKKVEDCLNHVALGLSENTGIPVDQRLIFVHGVVSLSIPDLKLPAPRIEDDPNTESSSRPMKTDSLIIAPAPKRKVAAAAQPSILGYSKSSYILNSHILVEFGLHVFSLFLNREKYRAANADSDILPMLDPLVPVVEELLVDPHAKLVTLSLRCICNLLRLPLPSMNDYAPKICSSIFAMLHKYSGNTSSENTEMVQTGFKAISILIRHVTTYRIEVEQLRVLLTYAEQALFDSKQQGIAFGVLKAILKKKLTLDELPDVMLKVAELVIKAEAVPVRLQSRKILLSYMVDYPLGKRITRFVRFFVKHLDYEKEVGRLSATEFLISVFNTFPKNYLSQESTYFLVTMSPYLINESSTSCVKAISAALRTLLGRLNTPTATTMFKMVLGWLRGSDLSHQRLAAQLSGIFVTVERENFQFRMKELLPEIVKLLDKSHSDSANEENRDSDLLLIQTLYAIIKMTQHCPSGLKDEANADIVNTMWEKIIYHLVHPHMWIRSLTSRLVGTLLGWYKPEEVANYIIKPSEGVVQSFLFCKDAPSRLHSLALDLITQLQSNMLDNQLADQIIKNLVFIGKVANRTTALNNVKAGRLEENLNENDSGDQEENVGEEDEEEQESEEEPEEKEDLKSSKNKVPTLPWLTAKLRREVNCEVVRQPRTPTKRLAVFKWMAAVALDLKEVAGKEAVIPVLKFFVSPLTREINDDGSPAEVKSLAQEVSELIKGLVGTETYSEALVAANSVLSARRRDRLAARKAEFATQPEKAVHKRLKKHFAKRVAKKVKIARLKGFRPQLKNLSAKKRLTKHVNVNT